MKDDEVVNETPLTDPIHIEYLPTTPIESSFGKVDVKARETINLILYYLKNKVEERV
jgi:hypothetical protein